MCFQIGVLLILDDVWDNVHEYREIVERLNIARGFGSVTVLTTRNLSIMHRINASVEVLLLLLEEHSWVLFCTHAFGTNRLPSNQELMKLAKDVCNECKCLPLALKVIGAAMKCKDDSAEWRSTLQDLRKLNAMVDKSVEQQLFNRLQINYDQLDEPTKTCFLYFAAYPEDSEIRTKELFQMWVVEDLFGDNLDEEDALDKAHSVSNELRKRSLVDDCKYYRSEVRVKMHDILRDLAMHMTRKGDEIVRENLFKPEMKNLKQFPIAWLGLPLKVKRMSLVGQNIKRFPSNFIAPQLGICMINASYDFSSLSSLSSSLQECVIEEGFFRNMANIKYMQLRSHANLKIVPTTIGTLRLLQYLDPSLCKALKKLPESIGGLGSLQHLYLCNCEALKELPVNIGGLGSLQHLDLIGCWALTELPESIGGLGSLQHLDMGYCVVLKELPESIGGLGSLQHLDMRSCVALKKLSESIGGLGSLKHLDMTFCGALKELLEGIGGLGSLQYLDMGYCVALKELPESIRGLGSLQHLWLENYEALKELPKSIGGLGSLQHLYLDRCEALKELPESIGGLRSLKYLTLVGCKALKELPESIGRLGSLQHLDMIYCVVLKELPESIGGLRSLKYLNLVGCTALMGLLESIGGLMSLQNLDLSDCKALKKLPKSIGGLGSLQHLNLGSCVALNELPDVIGGLGSLQLLDLKKCEAWKELPNFTKKFRLQILF